MPKRCSLIIAGLAVCLTTPSVAQILGYHSSSPAVISEIQPTTGADSVPSLYANCNATPPTPVNTLFGTGFISGMAMRDSVVYGLEWENDDIYLVTIAPEPLCAAGTRVGAQPIGFANLESLIWSADDGVFFSVDFDFQAHTGQLIQIDPSNGMGTAVSTQPMTRDVRVTGLQLDNQTLYGITSAFGERDSELITINRNSGLDTPVGFTGLPPNSLESLTADDTSGSLRLLAAGTTVYEINAQTGVASSVGGSYPDKLFALAAPERMSTATTSVVAAVLPGSRSIQLPATATAFATVINSGSAVGNSCSIDLLEPLDATLSYQATNPLTNEVTGLPDTPVSIEPGIAATFLISLTANSALVPTEVGFDFSCANSTNATPIDGVNTLLLSASATPVPDIVALVATLVDPGVVNLPGNTGSSAFAVATVNVGTGDVITVTADTGSASLPVSIGLCETDPADGSCKAQPSAAVSLTVNASETPTFSVFPTGGGAIPFDPAVNRIFVRFSDPGGAIRGSTSVAVRTQ